jgi:hypothetical protein
MADTEAMQLRVRLIAERQLSDRLAKALRQCRSRAFDFSRPGRADAALAEYETARQKAAPLDG